MSDKGGRDPGEIDSGATDAGAPATSSQRRASIPAPTTVPRPSKPPPPAIEPAHGSVPRPSARPQATPSTPPGERTRKGTLDGMQPRGLASVPSVDGSGRGASPDDDFDSEKTMVVDHDLDEAPTADYDPRTVGSYDPRARGVFSSAQPMIPAAPAAPRFDDQVLGTTQSSPRASELDEEEAPATVQMPTSTGKAASSRGNIPEARPSEGRRRTSRRTVKIPDDPVRRRELDLLAQTNERARPGSEATEQGVVAAPSIADLDFSDEITIVKPLRIISVGEEAPPAYSSPHATWPPPGHSMVRLGGTPDAASALGSAQLSQAPPSNRSPRVEPGATAAPDAGLEAQPLGAAHAVEPGWTPAAPPVAEQLARAGAIAGDSSVVEERPQAPIAEQVEGPSITVEADAGAPVSSELLEEIELDAHADVEVEVDVAPEPKRAPPPPPKRRPTSDAPKAPEQPRKGRPWWDELFSDEYIRTMDQLEPKVAKREVDFIEESLGLERHAIVLDLACGMGEITNEFAARGYGVVGLDYSTGMLARAQAGAKARQREHADYRPPSYVQSDMRELSYDEEFDGVYCWSTSFGFFDEETNANLLTRINRALRQGGLLLIDVVNRDYVAPRTPSLVWFEGEGAVCMDDVHVDFFSSRMKMKRTAMFEGGSSRELEYSIRLYTLHELGKLLHEAGFKVLEVTGHPAHRGVFFGAESPRVIVLAEKS